VPDGGLRRALDELLGRDVLGRPPVVERPLEVPVAQLADGVVVGSALVQAAGRSITEALLLTASLRAALDSSVG